MAAEQFQFSSTNVESAEFDKETGELSVTFARTGATYAFEKVPPELWEQFKASVSPGRFFNLNIKDRY